MHYRLALAGCLLALGCSKSSSQENPTAPGKAKGGAKVALSVKDWPTFRGAQRDSLSRDTGLLKSWPADGPPLAWKEPAKGLGKGYSSVAVVGDKVFTMGDAGDACYVFAVSRADGQNLWQTKVGKTGAPGGYEGPRCTPTVDGNLVYAVGQHGDLVCLDTAKGTEIWRKDLRKEFGGQVGGWGYSESPLVDGDKLLVTPGGRGATIVALNKKSGDVIWKSDVKGDRAEYASMAIAEVGGIRQYVQLLARNVVGIAADDGRVLWTYDKLGGNTANVPTPIVKGDLIFCSAGYGKGAALLKLTASQGNVEVQEQYFNRDLNNRHGGVVLIGGHLYGDRDDSGNPWCADLLTGQPVAGWKKQSKGSGSMSVTFADGFLYCRYQNGVVALVEATPTGYKEAGSFRIQNTRGPSWPHPVVVDGRLYLREQDQLWCFDVKAK